MAEPKIEYFLSDRDPLVAIDGRAFLWMPGEGFWETDPALLLRPSTTCYGTNRELWSQYVGDYIVQAIDSIDLNPPE